MKQKTIRTLIYITLTWISNFMEYNFFFQLSSANDGNIQINGTSGVAVAMGFYHYLKYFCNGQRTWAGQQTQLPESLPAISSPIKITTNDK